MAATSICFIVDCVTICVSGPPCWLDWFVGRPLLVGLGSGTPLVNFAVNFAVNSAVNSAVNFAVFFFPIGFWMLVAPPP